MVELLGPGRLSGALPSDIDYYGVLLSVAHYTFKCSCFNASRGVASVYAVVPCKQFKPLI